MADASTIAAERMNYKMQENFFSRLLSKGKSVAGAAKGATGPWFLMAIVLYFTDMLVTRFNGIDINEFLTFFQTFDPSSVLKIFFNGVVMTLLVAYLVFKKPDKREFMSFFILAEMFSLIFSLG